MAPWQARSAFPVSPVTAGSSPGECPSASATAERAVEGWVKIEHRPHAVVACQDDSRALDENPGCLQTKVKTRSALACLERENLCHRHSAAASGGQHATEAPGSGRSSAGADLHCGSGQSAGAG